jgi:uncharacterized protein YtpQ (UPF0354 family)
MDHIQALVGRAASWAMVAGSLVACASSHAGHARTPTGLEPTSQAPTAAVASESPPDYSTAPAFTRTALTLVRQGEPEGGWSTPAVLKLTNGKGLLVNLERIYGHCEVEPTSCEPELKHLVSEVLKVSTRPTPKATPDRVFAVVRTTAYFDDVPASGDASTKTLFDPLAANLIVVYVVDLGGTVRGVQEKDLAELGMTRAELSAAARRNLVARLPVPEGQPHCQPHALGLWSSGNYFESSRLLLNDFWQEMSAHSRPPIVVVAPATDTLLVACEPTPEELTKLRAMAEEASRGASRPVSTSLLKWTTNGWQQLPP